MVSGYAREDKMNSSTMYNDLTFKKKTARIDWRKIAAIDLDRVAKDLDVYTLQDNIDHITFCNIENEIDNRSIDPNYVKLFKLSQFTIEYLMHSQNYLTDVISSIEHQLNGSLLETDQLKKSNEKLEREMTEVKKENRKRKKMIETQQTLMSANTSNYHQCAYCSKVFLNVSYLQAHMTRRHADVSTATSQKQTLELERELERIKERLKITESDLQIERNARLGFVGSHSSHISQNVALGGGNSSDLRQMEEAKNAEIRRLRDELERNRDANRQINELEKQNYKFETMIKDLQERLGNRSNAGWIKDDIDLEKDTVLNQLKEIEKLKETIKKFEKNSKQQEDAKSKWKSREVNLKRDIKDRDEKIASLESRLTELQKSIGQSENELAITISELQTQLRNETELRKDLEKELAELKNRPPPITPRGQSQHRSPTPPPTQQATKTSATAVSNQPITTTTRKPINAAGEIYLSEYCPMTLQAIQQNPNYLLKFKNSALGLLEDELDELGIEKAERGLSDNDFRLKMSRIKALRKDRASGMPYFKELRTVFAEIADKYTAQRMSGQLSLRSSMGSRVTFNKNIAQQEPDSGGGLKQSRESKHKNHPHHRHHSNNQESEETDNDVSLSNALESDEEDDTEPTRSFLSDSKPNVKGNAKVQARQPVPIKQTYGTMDPDELSDLETISQLLSERSLKNKKSSASGNVSEQRRKIEKKIDSRQPRPKPSPNAVPIGFRDENELRNRQKDEDSFGSVSDLENDTRNQRPKSGLKSSLHDSNSSSIWVSETHTADANNNNRAHNNNNNNFNQNNHNHVDNNHAINRSNDFERPPTANSLKTSNFDSDEIETIG